MSRSSRLADRLLSEAANELKRIRELQEKERDRNARPATPTKPPGR